MYSRFSSHAVTISILCKPDTIVVLQLCKPDTIDTTIEVVPLLHVIFTRKPGQLVTLNPRTLLQAGLLCTPLLGFHKYTLHQWKGLLYGPVQPGDRGFDRVSLDRVDKIYADDHQDEARAHVHGQYFIYMTEFFKSCSYRTDSLYDFFVGAFSDQEAFCLGGEQDGCPCQDQ